jgi:penicillin-binding protein 1A
MPIVYAAAFEKGMFPGTMVKDEVIDNRQVMIGGTTGILGEWGPESVENRYEGDIPARTALVKSKNAATVRLGMQTGLEAVTALSKAAGIESPLRQYPSTYLGSSEVTLLEMTLANTAFPNEGWRPKQPFIIERIEEKGGRVIFQSRSEKARVMKATTAYEVHSCLADVLDRGTADKTFTEYGVRRYPLGGKTGTAYNFTDVWFVGYSSAITCGVWAGFDKPRTTIYRGAFSNQIVLPAWAAIMQASFAQFKPKDIPAPKGIIKVELCSESGQLATDKCFDLVDNKETGEKVKRSTTYFEIATDAQAPKVGCTIHGGPTPGVRPLITGGPGNAGPGGQQWPRAEVVVDPNVHPLVNMKGPTVLGEDPYNSIQAVANVQDMRQFAGKVAPMDSSAKAPKPIDAPAAPEVRRAVPVTPGEKNDNPAETPIKLDPPPPLEF